jgi:hypothetical protein
MSSKLHTHLQKSAILNLMLEVTQIPVTKLAKLLGTDRAHLERCRFGREVLPDDVLAWLQAMAELASRAPTLAPSPAKITQELSARSPHTAQATPHTSPEDAAEAEFLAACAAFSQPAPPPPKYDGAEFAEAMVQRTPEQEELLQSVLDELND